MTIQKLPGKSFHPAAGGARAPRALRVLLLAAAAVAGSLAWPAMAEKIDTVLQRSHQMRLTAYTARAVDDRRAEALRADFQRLLARAELPEAVRRDVQLLVVDGPLLGETLAGHVVVVNAGLADAAEGERLFTLAHELGHVQLGHWAQLGEVYRKHVPGEVTKEATDAVANALGREASALSHGHEFAADAFAWRLVREFGIGLDSAAAVFHHMPNLGDTPTHPASRKRMAALRMIGDEANVTAAAPSGRGD
jgi:Zn-dependent protease with chaperone function